jgi:formate hydrogenlyase subunit 3/multisubunit Na+/H+ antiporter MnhD subunit
VNSALLLMLVPLVGGLTAYVVWPRNPRLATLSGALTSGVLALLTLWLPVGEPIRLLGFEIPVDQAFTILGREFIFETSGRPALVFLHLAGTFLFAGTLAVPMRRLFIPTSLSILGAMAAALFVRPFLYAAIFLALSAAAFGGILSDPDHPRSRGALRLLVFVVLGMPFILLAGSQLSLSGQIPSELDLLNRILVLLGIGFAFLMALPPFHFWVVDIADDSPPYAVAFVLTLFQGASLFFLLRFLAEFAWLRTIPQVHQAFGVAGAAMCLMGGGLALIQNRLGRLTGYAATANMGVILLALSSGKEAGTEAALVMLALRGLSLGVWGVALTVLRQRHPQDALTDLRGRAKEQPLASMAVVIAGLSLAGLPGLAGFSGHWATLQVLGAPAALANYAPLLAIAGSMIACELAYLRFASALLAGAGRLTFRREEGRMPALFLGAGMLMLILLGLLPQLVLPFIARSAILFGNLSLP